MYNSVLLVAYGDTRKDSEHVQQPFWYLSEQLRGSTSLPSYDMILYNILMTESPTGSDGVKIIGAKSASSPQLFTSKSSFIILNRYKL